MQKINIITPPRPRHLLFYFVGMAVLVLNKIRYGFLGYRAPRPFAPTEYEKAIEYDKRVVNNWLSAIREYNGESIDGKAVLELGPGADLGQALILLDLGAKRYVTVDANRLIDKTPTIFYEKLLDTLAHGQELKIELDKTLSGNDDRIRYIVDKNFDLSVARNEKIDVVVSQAAFEHFSDVEKTIKQLDPLLHEGSILIAEIDLMTHTGFLRGRDPLNIFRYSNFFYKLARFSGIPNRLRPIDYKNILERNGWRDIEIVPLQELSFEYVKKIKPRLARRFRKEDAGMNILSVLIRATKR